MNSEYAAQAVASITWKENSYIHFLFTFTLENQTLAPFVLQDGVLVLQSLSVFSVLVQHPVHVLHVMSPASAGDVKVGSSLNVSWEKGEGEETHRRQKLRKFNRHRSGFREVIFTSEN